MRNFSLIRRSRHPLLAEFDLSGFFEDFFKGPLFRFGLAPYEAVPAVDVYEKDNRIIVKAELAGINPKELELSVDGNLLSITGEKKHETELKKENYYRMERAYGKFQRVVVLPAEVKAEEAKANYSNGVLHIELPKAEARKQNKIKIKIN